MVQLKSNLARRDPFLPLETATRSQRERWRTKEFEIRGRLEEWYPDRLISLERGKPNKKPESEAALLDRVRLMTGTLFPDRIVVERDWDPDFPEDVWFVIEVEARGEFSEILDRELVWHDRLREAIGSAEAARFRLCVFPT